MSVENVKAFFGKVEGDKGLQEELKALAEERKAQEDAAMAKVVAVAAKAGFPFTADDLSKVQSEAVGELSEDQLRQVAGGSGSSCPFCAHQMTRYVRS